jgi:hypothetical protein
LVDFLIGVPLDRIKPGPLQPDSHFACRILTIKDRLCRAELSDRKCYDQADNDDDDN